MNIDIDCSTSHPFTATKMLFETVQIFKSINALSSTSFESINAFPVTVYRIRSTGHQVSYYIPFYCLICVLNENTAMDFPKRFFEFKIKWMKNNEQERERERPLFAQLQHAIFLAIQEWGRFRSFQ